MSFIPKKNGKASRLSLLLIITGITLFAVSGILPYPGMFQILAVALSVLGIQLLVRFVLSDFKYIIEDSDDGTSDLIIYKSQGKNRIKVCHISLAAVEEISKSKKNPQADKRYNYVQNVGADESNIIFSDGDKKIEIIIEADNAFLDAIKARMGRGDGDIAFAM